MISVTLQLLSLCESEAEDLAMLDELRALQSSGEGSLDVALYPYGDKHLHLQTLRAERNAEPGTGTRFMTALADFADRFGVTITLQTGERETAPVRTSSRAMHPELNAQINSQGTDRWKRTTSSNRLKTFYRRFGFVLNKSKGRYDLRGNMFRAPKVKK